MKKWILILLLIVLISIGTFIKIYVTAMEPVKAEEQKDVAIVKKSVELKKVNHFQLYNGNETVGIIEGTNKEGKNLIIWVPEKSKKIIIKNANSGITKTEAIRKVEASEHPKKIISVRLAMKSNVPLWEIYYLSNDNLINYYYLGFDNGQWWEKFEHM